MRLLKRNFERDGSGSVALVLEEADDVWQLYNLAVRGDRLRSATLRKVQKESGSGSVSAEVKKTVLTIAVQKADYDVSTNLLRLSGVNVVENPFVKLGQAHTIEVTLKSKVSLWKKSWDFVYRQTLDEALDVKNSSETAVVLLEPGAANIFLLTSSLAKQVFRLRLPLPKRRGVHSGYSKTLDLFFKQLYGGILSHVDFDVIKCFLIAGPGFLKDDFLQWMLREAEKENNSAVSKRRHLFMTATASSAFRHSLNEVLENPAVKAQMAETKALKCSASLDQLYRTLQTDPDKACYGPREVAYAVEEGAVESLLVTEELFRSASVKKRKFFVHLVETVKRAGAEVVIFSDMHVSGEQLSQLSGIAATLRYPLPELDCEALDNVSGGGATATENDDEDDEEGNSSIVSAELEGMGLPTAGDADDAELL